MATIVAVSGESPKTATNGRFRRSATIVASVDEAKATLPVKTKPRQCDTTLKATGDTVDKIHTNCEPDSKAPKKHNSCP